MKKMNPEECQTECEINEMKVPSFYDLERFHNFYPPLVRSRKVEDTRVCKINSCAFIRQLTDISVKIGYPTIWDKTFTVKGKKYSQGLPLKFWRIFWCNKNFCE